MRKRTFKSVPANSGFTIVEFLVVLVVIAIIAAITLVGYNLVVNNTVTSSIKSNLKNAAKQLVVDGLRSTTGVYPATLAAANNGSGLNFPSSTTTTYTVDNTDTPKTFCLTATQNSQTYFITQEATPLPGPCPVLYLDMGTTTSYPGSGTAWYDLSGRGNNGAMTNCTTYNSANNGYMIFNGASSKVTVADNNSLDFGTGSFTVEAWMKFSAYGPDYRDLIYKGALSNLSGWRFGLSTSGKPHVLIGDSSSFTDSDLGTTAVSLNTWHDVAIVYNRTSNAVGYIDGVRVGTAGISTRSGAVDNVSPILIGDGSAIAWFNGQIGIVSIRNVAFGDSDIQNSFNATRFRYGV